MLFSRVEREFTIRIISALLPAELLSSNELEQYATVLQDRGRPTIGYRYLLPTLAPRVMDTSVLVNQRKLLIAYGGSSSN
jgi:hypothetical protein